jgi:predicted enzyme related to lactoylglutathione lyase
MDHDRTHEASGVHIDYRHAIRGTRAGFTNQPLKNAGHAEKPSDHSPRSTSSMMSASEVYLLGIGVSNGWRTIMNFNLTTIITQNLEKMSDFYQKLLQIEPQVYRNNYAMFTTDTASLALWRQSEAEKFGLDFMRSAANASMLIEFEVNDIDAEYQRLQSLSVDWVQEPTTFPWEMRAFYIRDPEGNIVNFYSSM